jgi:hypothetical protein
MLPTRNRPAAKPLRPYSPQEAEQEFPLTDTPAHARL